MTHYISLSYITGVLEVMRRTPYWGILGRLQGIICRPSTVIPGEYTEGLKCSKECANAARFFLTNGQPHREHTQFAEREKLSFHHFSENGQDIT